MGFFDWVHRNIGQGVRREDPVGSLARGAPPQRAGVEVVRIPQVNIHKPGVAPVPITFNPNKPGVMPVRLQGDPQKAAGSTGRVETPPWVMVVGIQTNAPIPSDICDWVWRLSQRGVMPSDEFLRALQRRAGMNLPDRQLAATAFNYALEVRQVMEREAAGRRAADPADAEQVNADDGDPYGAGGSL